MEYGYDRYVRYCPSVSGSIEGLISFSDSLAAGEVWNSSTRKTLFLGLLFLVFTFFPPVRVTDSLFLETTSEARAKEISTDAVAPGYSDGESEGIIMISSGVISTQLSKQMGSYGNHPGYGDRDPEIQHPEGD